MYASRVQHVQNFLIQKGVQGLLVTNPKNIFYFTGFIGISLTERESVLLVSQNEAVLFIPQMYEERGQKAKGVQEKTIALKVDYERFGLLTQWIQRAPKEGTVLCEGNNLTLSEHERIQKIFPGKLEPAHLLIEQFRLKKDEHEKSFLQIAAKITDTVFQKIVDDLKNGDTDLMHEHDIVERMRLYNRQLGGGAFGFDPIIAVGGGSAEPHYFTGGVKLEKGKNLLMDFGMTFEGYSADLTRTVFLGSADEEFKKMYQLVKECNEKCIERIRPGIETKKLHEQSFNFFAQHHLEKSYLHSLGHGVGLDVHESPSVGMQSTTILEPGMVITIEPGLYFPGKFGIRIEDMVYVTETGYEVLSSQSSKDLIQIDYATS